MVIDRANYVFNNNTPHMSIQLRLDCTQADKPGKRLAPVTKMKWFARQHRIIAVQFIDSLEWGRRRRERAKYGGNPGAVKLTIIA